MVVLLHQHSQFVKPVVLCGGPEQVCCAGDCSSWSRSLSFSLFLCLSVSLLKERTLCFMHRIYVFSIFGLLLSLSINSFLSPSGWPYLLDNQGRSELAAMNVRKSL